MRLKYHTADLDQPIAATGDKAGGFGIEDDFAICKLTVSRTNQGRRRGILKPPAECRECAHARVQSVRVPPEIRQVRFSSSGICREKGRSSRPPWSCAAEREPHLLVFREVVTTTTASTRFSATGLEQQGPPRPTATGAQGTFQRMRNFW